jgi:hypothetical protein
MKKEIFHHNLTKALERVLSFTRERVINPLPSSCRCLIFPNSSYDGHPLEDDEEVFPGESLPKGEYLGPLEAEEVVEHLWRDGKVPEWINMCVYSYDENHTYVELECCGRFTANDEALYHIRPGVPPFSVQSPALPWKWNSVEEHGKFDLFWLGRKEVKSRPS